MDYKDFVKETVLNFSSESFDSIKKVLVGEYLFFSVIPESEITKEILAEKLCDYFEKLEIETGKPFDKHVDTYTDNLDDIVGKRVAKTPQAKKNDPNPIIVPRTRKYYDKAKFLKESRAISTDQLVGYTRIMMCLYTAIMKNQYKPISDFEYAKDCLDMDRIISSMKNEREPGALGLSKKKFNIENLYCSDTCTFVLASIILQKVMED